MALNECDWWVRMVVVFLKNDGALCRQAFYIVPRMGAYSKRCEERRPYAVLK